MSYFSDGVSIGPHRISMYYYCFNSFPTYRVTLTTTSGNTHEYANTRNNARECLPLLILVLLRDRDRVHWSSRRERGERFYFCPANEKGVRVVRDNFKAYMNVIIVRINEKRSASMRNRMKERREESEHAIGARLLPPADHAIGGRRWRGGNHEREAIKITDKREEWSFIERIRLREHAEREMLTRSSTCNETKEVKYICNARREIDIIYTRE